MTTKKLCLIRVGIAVLLALFALPLLPAHSDTVTLKDGTKLEGTITVDTADFIKLVLSRSGSIKETKLIKRSDIQKIEKVSPDALAMAKIKASLPAPSLTTSSNYQTLIKTGPESFLKAFPNSLLKGDAQKILKELNAEKAKVDRGAIKLNGEWISAERHQNFKSLINSQIRLYTMKQKAARNDFNSALRDLQILEEQYLGTPAYPEAIKVALSILPTYGNILTRQLKDAEFLNKKREADIQLLPLANRAQTEAAYKKEQDRYKALAEQEKKTGIKWRSVNRRNKESIAPMIDTIRKELASLNKIDTAKLEAQAQKLVEVDELIYKNKLTEAKELLIESGGKITSTNRKGSSRKRSSKSKTSYSSELSQKIAGKIKAAELAAENATANAKAKETAAAITQSASKIAEKGKEAAEHAGEKAADNSAGDALAAARAARKKVANTDKKVADAKASASASNKPKSTKKKTKPKKRTPSTASSDGGGINFQFILIGFAAVMGIVIFVMKKKGMGGSGGEE